MSTVHGMSDDGAIWQLLREDKLMQVRRRSREGSATCAIIPSQVPSSQCTHLFSHTPVWPANQSAGSRPSGSLADIVVGLRELLLQRNRSRARGLAALLQPHVPRVQRRAGGRGRPGRGGAVDQTSDKDARWLGTPP